MEDHNIVLSNKQKELIEKLGVIVEKTGSTPTTSRVQSLLVVSDETALTFDQIKDTLQLSKSATSIAINYLLQANKLEYITKPGDRRRYFCPMLHRWKDQIKEQKQGIGLLSSVLTEILQERSGATIVFNSHLKDLIDFLEFYQEKIKNLFEEWERSK